MNRLTPLLAAALIASAPALATSHQPAAAASAPAVLSEGEVRKVDKEAGKVTIKHGPIANLDMPPMTMVFRVKEPVMLDKLKAGDTVRFKAEKLGGNYTVTEVQPAR